MVLVLGVLATTPWARATALNPDALVA
jgi:hypothetical protein